MYNHVLLNSYHLHIIKSHFMKIVLLLLTMTLACITLTAQTLAKNDPLKYDADYYLMEKDFTKALNTYKNILRSEPDNADIKYKTGICYLNSENEKDLAIPYLEEASQKISEKYNSNSFDETNAPIDALFLLGSAYRINNQIDRAMDSYREYRNYLDPKDSYNLNVVDQYLKSCELAAIMQKSPVPVSQKNLGSPVNNEFPNYNPVLSGDGKTMFYTSPARQGYDIFLTTLEDTTWSVPKNVTTLLGTGKYMRTCDLSFDGLTLLLSLDDPMNADIYISRFNKGKWSKAEPLGKEINSKFNETHASLSVDGRVLYFTSNRKGGEGDLDIYKAEPDEKGSWGKPVNLGPVINTTLNEETPFITESGDRLYFSSEGHSGIGGYDIYYYDFSNPSKGVVNLGYPINGTDNDLFFVPTGDGRTAYYAFKGEDTKGGRDIYRMYIHDPDIPEVIIAENVDVTEEISEPEVAELPVLEELPVVEELPFVADVTELQEVIELPELLEVPEVTEVTEVPEVPEESVEDTTKFFIAEMPPAEDPVSPAASSYRIQVMALLKPVDLARFHDLSGVMVARNGDRWYRYTLGNTTDKNEAELLLASIKSKGYRDAFIRPFPGYPRYTIQVMAVPGPVVNLEMFSDLPAISVIKGQDKFCRYTTGEFPTKDEAISNLGRIRELGFTTAFVTRMK
jgi:tetratricopeptide (TPR) repeat protein